MEYEGKDNDDLTSENEGPLDWSLEMLLEHAKIMFWKRYYKKTGMNIKQNKVQEKDKITTATSLTPFYFKVLFPVVSEHSPQNDVRFKKVCRDRVTCVVLV